MRRRNWFTVRSFKRIKYNWKNGSISNDPKEIGNFTFHANRNRFVVEARATAFELFCQIDFITGFTLCIPDLCGRNAQWAHVCDLFECRIIFPFCEFREFSVQNRCHVQAVFTYWGNSALVWWAKLFHTSKLQLISVESLIFLIIVSIGRSKTESNVGKS